MLFSGFSDEEFSVVRLRPVMGSDRGEPFLDWSTPSREGVRADVQPGNSVDQSSAGRDAILAEFAVLDYDSPRGFWQESDRVEIDGVAYQIEGRPREWPSPTGGLSHTQLFVNRWDG